MSVLRIVKRLLWAVEREPWQIAAARYCVVQSERTFTKENLVNHLKDSYKVSTNQIEQFWNEEISWPSGRGFPREQVSKNGQSNYWIPPLDLVAKVTDYEELKEARKNAKKAFILSLVAIIIAMLTLVVTILQ